MNRQEIILISVFLVWSIVIVGVIAYDQIKYREYYKKQLEEE